ncbi:hypothetical protein J116_020540 [Streptomyces thermolilacinus SPC6]|uniref:Uncharacterized protein n=1 Tax=Streptomyces thermolilacinus SPC6 TaxID=1306406 RepID=A0A1D3DW00_9ACTN|nr:hypothetical protein J116_020540 [Streptomyces thermolilacinus SPC6]
MTTVVTWAEAYDCYGETRRVPELLGRVGREGGADAWEELYRRLVLECDMVFPASFAALPRLVRLASRSALPRGLAGAIVRGAAGPHGCDELFARCSGAVAELGEVLDRHLAARPADYLPAFLDLLAVRGEYHWSAVLGDFSDDFYEVACPHCATDVTIAIGVHGRYSALRDWQRGDVDRRPLRPAGPEGLAGAGRWMYATAVRDGHGALADGIVQLFGRAECPRCASVFGVADEYAAAHRPVM